MWAISCVSVLLSGAFLFVPSDTFAVIGLCISFSLEVRSAITATAEFLVTSVVDNYSQSTPESWAQFAHDNIARAENERMASVQLRTLIDNVINDTSRDMKEQADAVDSAFQSRVVEVENAKTALEDNLRKVSMSLRRSAITTVFKFYIYIFNLYSP